MAEPTTYDKKYRAGGFNYEEQRERQVAWVAKHYVEPFGLKPGSTLLDVGSGDGFWCSVFHELGFKATGIELSVGGVEVAREKYPDCEFEVGSAEEPLAGGDRKFDVVFCRAISHFCRTDLLNPPTLRVIENMANAVTDEGTVLLSFYTRRTKENQNPCADHMISDIVRLAEVYLDPFRIDRVANYVQLGARLPRPAV